MTLNWGSLEPAPPAELEYTGPEYVFSGNNCRITAKSLNDEQLRNDELRSRLYRLVATLAPLFPGKYAEEETEGFTRIYGGEPARYVKGVTEKEVFTTIGRTLLEASSAAKEEAAGLGITALLEW